MRRREFIGFVGGAVAVWPLATRAQQATVPVVGFLHTNSVAGNGSRLAAFRKGLSETGFVEGETVAIEYRWADGHYDRLQDLLADLLRQRVAVIFAAPAPAAVIAKRATHTVPIIFQGGADPVRLGLVASFNRPGGNITGIVNLSNMVIGKRIELIHQVVPNAELIAVLLNPDNPNFKLLADDARAAQKPLGLQIQLLEARSLSEINASFAKLHELQAGALVIGPDGYLTSQGNEFATLATRYAVPTIGELPQFVAAGGLMSYGADLDDAYHLAGIYTGRVLNGEKPADLPVQQSTKIKLAINLKTAKTLGLTFPLTLLGRADEVIE